MWRTRRRIYALLLLSLLSYFAVFEFSFVSLHFTLSIFFESLGLKGECWLRDLARRLLRLRHARDLAGLVRRLFLRQPRAGCGDYFSVKLGLGAETISPPTSGLVWRLFLRQPRAWCGGYFSVSLGLGAEAISPRASRLISIFSLCFCLVLSLIVSHLVIEMISFFIYLSIFSLSVR
jgi:hypothetical protein